MKKKTLSNKEVRHLNESLAKYNFSFDKKELVEVVEYDKYTAIKSSNKVLFFYVGQDIYPTLKMILESKLSLKKVAVDMGAVKFVVKGADIMRPGIIEIDEGILKDEIICIVDINNKKPLALGKSLLNSEEMKASTSGKAIQNIHYIGDEIWNLGS